MFFSNKWYYYIYLLLNFVINDTLFYKEFQHEIYELIDQVSNGLKEFKYV